jgi:ATP-binding cassette, subfamily B, multidrug efflux pump
LEFLKKYIKKYWKLFLLALLFLSCEASCDLLQPTIMSKIVDIGVVSKNFNYIFKMGAFMLLITLGGAIAAVSRNIISSRVSQKFGTELRADLFKKINSLSFENLDKFENASLITRLTNDITIVQQFANGLMRILVKAPLLCLGAIIMAIHLNPKLSLIILIIVPLIIFFIILNLKIGFPFFTKVQQSLDKLNGVLREYLSGVRVVKAFNRFEYEKERFENANENQVKSSTNAMRVMSFFSPGIGLTVNIGIVLVIWIGGINVNNKEMHVGQIIAFINYMSQILFSLMTISMVFTTFVRAKASAERIGEVFSEIDTMKKTLNTTYFKTGKIDFENVNFSYKGSSGIPVLKNISFSCEPGETLGIIGSTGSGKTTLVNLIPRFYDVTSGSIKINGVDIIQIEPEKLREKIALVPQKTILFTGTIKDNIKWGKEDATIDEIEEVSKISQSYEFVKNFPESYDTILGQGGVNLSGGQKQRISIARALIKKPEIIILDDSTSALDASTEIKIRKSLKEYSKGLTTIIISQRIISVLNANKILVLENGKIAGQGNHKYLMKNCDVYRDIFVSQIGKEDDL